MSIIQRRLLKVIPAIIFVIGVSAICFWLLGNPSKEFTLSEPGMDSAVNTEVTEENIVIGEFYERFKTLESPLKEIWPRFRGEFSDNIYRSNVKLTSNFGGRIPEILWSADLGEGHAGPAIYQGKVYLLDYDEQKRADMLRCYSLISGEEIWRRWYNVQVKRNHGMSRTVPAVTKNYIVTIGPRGHVMCVDRESGDFRWGIDIEKQYSSEIPLWYTGQCPIVENDIAVIATGGSSLMIGVDCASGKVLWETPNKNNWKMSHSSVMPFVYGGRKMYVYSAVGGVAGVAADGPDAGNILWKTSVWTKPVVASSAVCMPDGKIFLTAGYGAGSAVLQLSQNNGSYKIELIKSYKPGEALSCEQQTPILADGRLFGIMPKDARSFRNQLVCVKPEDPSQIVWSSGSTSRFGLGPMILADDKFYLLNDDATLYIIKRNTKVYTEIDKVKLFDGVDAWAPIAIADGYMVLRDSKKMICIDLNI